MNILLTILLSVLIFGFLIFIHEFGHYIFARIFHVTIREFSIGMGPKLLWYDSKKTGIRYSLAMFPIGGYVAMEGEDGANDKTASDPNSFDKKPAWQRLIITAAGASINILCGFLVMIILCASFDLGGTKIAMFYKDSTNPDVRDYYEISSADSGLLAGDTVIAIDGHRVRIYEEMSYEIMRRATKPVSVTVLRDGEQMTIENVVFPTAEEQGQNFGMMDFVPYAYTAEKTVGDVLTYSWHKSCMVVRMCWESIYDLITGRYTLAAISGPVGITEVIGEAAENGGAESVLYIFCLISINLGVMNLLPIPALDGGRVVLLLVEIFTKKKLPAKIETVMNTVFLMLLLVFSFGIMVKDIFKLLL